MRKDGKERNKKWRRSRISNIKGYFCVYVCERVNEQKQKKKERLSDHASTTWHTLRFHSAIPRSMTRSCSIRTSLDRLDPLDTTNLAWCFEWISMWRRSTGEATHMFSICRFRNEGAVDLEQYIVWRTSGVDTRGWRSILALRPWQLT